MNASEFLTKILDPGIAWCQAIPGWTIPFDDRARVLMLAIAAQESGLTARVQNSPGASAHGFFQFERNGGVKGVLTHPATYKMATAACAKAGVPSDAVHAWGIMSTSAGDDLAVAFARLLLWTDAGALPEVGNGFYAWEYYERLWRPGKPRPDDWPANHKGAVDAVKGAA